MDSPACLIADENDLGGNLQRLLKSMGQDAPESKPILEINLDHDLVSSLAADNPDIEDWAHVLFDQAAIKRRRTPKGTCFICKTSQQATGPGSLVYTLIIRVAETGNANSLNYIKKKRLQKDLSRCCKTQRSQISGIAHPINFSIPDVPDDPPYPHSSYQKQRPLKLCRENQF